MSELIDRETAIEFIKKAQCSGCSGIGLCGGCSVLVALKLLEKVPTASPWHRVDEPPKEAGEYIVAYHPCYWDDVKTKVTKVGIDNFRGKSAWAKKKFQRVTHWMEKPKPPKEDA